MSHGQSTLRLAIEISSADERAAMRKALLRARAA
jgi:hypothetical protein